MSRGRKTYPIVGIVAVLGAFLAAGIAAGREPSAETPSAYGYLKLFNEVLALVRNSYVEDVPQPDLLRGAYEGLLASLDGESEYLSSAEYEAVKAARPASEADAGIRLTRRDGALFVAAVMPGSDAQAKGLRLGDLVRRVGDRAARDLTLPEAERALLGPAGSKVTLAVSRRDEPRREEVEVTRRKLQPPAPRLDPQINGVAVVRVPTLSPGASRALSGILDRLQKERLRLAVLDLRGNAWGELEEAVKASSLFAGERVVAMVRDRKGSEKALRGSGPGSAWSGGLLLLTDAGTGGPAEIFVASLVESVGATQAGEATLGRGGEQEFIPLGNGDYISLTVRKYVSPGGKAWHGTGLEPSIPIPIDLSLPVKERLDQQLRRAADWLREHGEGAKAA